MNCEKYHKDLSLLVDGELAPDASAALMEHVAVCSACRATYHAMTALQRRLNASAPRMDAVLIGRVKSCIADRVFEHAHTPAMPLWGQIPLLAAIVLIALGLGNLAGRSISDIISGDQREAALEIIVADSTRSLADVMMELGPEEQTR